MTMIRSLSCVLMILAGSAAQAQQAYPSRPIRIIVPFAPGGTSDILARLIGAKMTENWGQQVLVDNRPGTGLSGQADPHRRAVSAGRHLRHSVEIDRAQAHGKMGTAGGGGEPTRRSRRDRR